MSSLESKPYLKSDDVDPPIDEDQGIIRCICGFTEDDGFTIQCENCLVWQHAICVNITQSNVPDEYLCEQCFPRKLNVKRAVEYQKQRIEKEYRLAKENHKKKRSIEGRSKSRDKKSSRSSDNSDNTYTSFDHDLDRCIVDSREVLDYIQKNLKSFSSDSQENDLSSSDAISSVHSSSIPSIPDLETRSVGNPRYKQYGLFTKHKISSKQFVSEYKGRILFKSSYKEDPKNYYDVLKHPRPFVAFHPDLDLCVDARNEGNVLRYVRRSCKPNLHLSSLEVVDYPDPKIILGVYARHEINEGEELTLNWCWEGGEVPSIFKGQDSAEVSSYLSSTEGRRICKIWRQCFYGTKCNCTKDHYCETQNFFNLLDLCKESKRSYKNSPSRKFRSSEISQDNGNIGLMESESFEPSVGSENEPSVLSDSKSTSLNDSNFQFPTGLEQKKKLSKHKYHLSLSLSKSEFMNQGLDYYNENKRSKTNRSSNKSLKSNGVDGSGLMDIDYDYNINPDGKSDRTEHRSSYGYYPTNSTRHIDKSLFKNKKQKRSRIRFHNTFLSLKRRWMDIYQKRKVYFESSDLVKPQEDVKPKIDINYETNKPEVVEELFIPLSRNISENIHEDLENSVCDVDLVDESNDEYLLNTCKNDDNDGSNALEDNIDITSISEDPKQSMEGNHLGHIAETSSAVSINTRDSKVMDVKTMEVKSPINSIEDNPNKTETTNSIQPTQSSGIELQSVSPEKNQKSDGSETKLENDVSKLNSSPTSKKNRLSLEEYNKKRKVVPFSTNPNDGGSLIPHFPEPSLNKSIVTTCPENSQIQNLLEIGTSKTPNSNLLPEKKNDSDLVLISGTISKPVDSSKHSVSSDGVKDDLSASEAPPVPATKVKVSLEEYNRRRMLSTSSKILNTPASVDNADSSVLSMGTPILHSIDRKTTNGSSKDEEITQLLRKELDGIVAPTVISNALAMSTSANTTTPPYGFKSGSTPFSVSSAATSFTGSSISSSQWSNKQSTKPYFPVIQNTNESIPNLSPQNKASKEHSPLKVEAVFTSENEAITQATATNSTSSIAASTQSQNLPSLDSYDNRLNENKSKLFNSHNRSDYQHSHSNSYSKYDFNFRRYDKDRTQNNYSYERDRSRDRVWDAERDKQWDRQRDPRDGRNRFYSRDRERHGQVVSANYPQSVGQASFNAYRRDGDRYSNEYLPNRVDQNYEKEAGEITYQKERKRGYEREKDRWRDPDRERDAWASNQNSFYQSNQSIPPGHPSINNNTNSGYIRSNVRPSHGFGSNSSYNPTPPYSNSRPMSPASETSNNPLDLGKDKRGINSSPLNFTGGSGPDLYTTYGHQNKNPSFSNPSDNQPSKTNLRTNNFEQRHPNFSKDENDKIFSTSNHTPETQKISELEVSGSPSIRQNLVTSQQKGRFEATNSSDAISPDIKKPFVDDSNTHLPPPPPPPSHLLPPPPPPQSPPPPPPPFIK
ncbi:SET domain-containing protein 4 [Smittium mucronatum]|uniref:SET domain-containing protein 4 n=1 Tax=Smittium mucronatum TaxID=133383 RepID=A0A1R0GPL9_9FUNG|nr:SET domain-containing protein 4 [Smittium mucronatum]